MGRYLTIFLLLSAASVSAHPADAAVVKKKSAAAAIPTKSITKRPAAKADPVSKLAEALVVNDVKFYPNLYKACLANRLPFLALSLEGYADKLKPEKSEFETDAEFALRQERIENAINSNHSIVACQPLDDNEEAPFTYTAETEQFALSIADYQNIRREYRSLGSYPSSTRMGVKMTVRASVTFDFDVKLHFDALKGGSCAPDLRGYVKTMIPVPRPQAPTVKASAYLAIIGRIVHPIIEKDVKDGQPSLTDPYDDRVESWEVHLQPNELAVVMPDGTKIWRCSAPGLGDGQAAEAAMGADAQIP